MMTTAKALLAGHWREARDPVGHFRANDPATGEAIGPVFPVHGQQDVETALVAAEAAVPVLLDATAQQIAGFLEAYASRLEAGIDELVVLAHAETALAINPRLSQAEMPRTVSQLRQAAAAALSSSWRQPTIDTAAGLRSHLAPLGKPVLVFGPNNFPFAFNAVAGSDFASAIVARSPVIAKAHPAHPGTSRRLAELAAEALQQVGLPAATVQLLYHVESEVGLALCADPRLGAIGFTGSRAAGLALKAAADTVGTPFYGELSSINPVLMLPGALAERGETLAQSLFGSATMGSGQFCTQPGLVLVPKGAEGDAFVAQVASRFANASPQRLFTAAAVHHVEQGLAAWLQAGAEMLAQGSAEASGFACAAALCEVSAERFIASGSALQQEIFGPLSLLVRHEGVAQARAVLDRLEGNLTGTLFTAHDGSDDGLWQELVPHLRGKVGRLIENQMPTGVAVSPAMNHGGPFPSSTQVAATSVGMPAAIRRFSALHCYDQVREDRLPDDLRDANPAGIWRQIDGIWSQQAVGG